MNPVLLSSAAEVGCSHPCGRNCSSFSSVCCFGKDAESTSSGSSGEDKKRKDGKRPKKMGDKPDRKPILSIVFN